MNNVNCLICKENQNVKFLDEYKLEIQEDIKYFKDVKIYRCESCDFSFVDPIPNEEDLNYFYEHTYRSLNRPPYWLTENYDDLKKQYLEDKNLNYLLYLTTLIDISKIEKVYDFGAGYGDLGFALKKKFPQLKFFCSENDKHCIKILEERDYTNIENIEDINDKFDLIITLHSLEHMSDTSIFSKFKKMLNPDGYIFFEVPNCPKEYFDGRPYDSPHLSFYTKQSINKIAMLYKFKILNFSFSSYSFKDDHKFQKVSQNLYKKMNNSKFSLPYLKSKIKKIIPYSLIKLRQNFLKLKSMQNENRINWFANNTGDNCYIRGILVNDK
jgi:2-polyprenyl-3-methyl-5-hydroxy-6-metoxy-1,4-benzoquinol methylase